MGNCLANFFCKTTHDIGAATSQQPSSLVTEVHEPSFAQSFAEPVRALPQNGIPLQKLRKAASSLPHTQHAESSANLLRLPLPSHRVRSRSSVTSSSSGFHSYGTTSSATASRSLPTNYHIRRPLTSTVRKVLPKDFKFRILVIGKSRSGKSSLIKAIFKVDVTAAPERPLGESDINFEYFPEDNRYLIVHECSGFDSRARDSQTFLNIRDFISRRTDTSRSASERLHAVWICVPASDAISGELGEGAEEILGMRAVPVILVLTKFDIVVSKVLFEIAPDDPQQHGRARADAHAMYEDSCRRLFHKDVPTEVVSENPRYTDLIEKLVETTNRFILDPRDSLAASGVRGEKSQISPVALAWSAALRVGHGVVIRASIEVGQSRLWQCLWSNVHFADHSLRSCVDIIHMDLVEIWNLNDRTQYLSSDGFKAQMSHLVKDLVVPAGMMLDPSPTGAGVEFADWVHRGYKGSKKNVRCIMGYIVDLMAILDVIFCTTSSDISAENVLSVIEKHVSSGKRDKIHHNIRVVTEAFDVKFSVPQDDLILARIIDLIWESCIAPARDPS
ncbi:hypothetical protein V8E53_008577 [Lactarius tabidus]